MDALDNSREEGRQPYRRGGGERSYPTPAPPPPPTVAEAPPRPTAETHGTCSTARPPSPAPQITSSLPGPSRLSSGMLTQPQRRDCGRRLPVFRLHAARPLFQYPSTAFPLRGVRR